MNRVVMFLRVLIVIAVAEIAVMSILRFFQVPEGLGKDLTDAGLLVLLSAPLLYIWVTRMMARRDGKVLERAAHALKGSVGYFAAQAAYEAALKLEMMNHKGDLRGADTACAALEEEVNQVRRALSDLRKEVVR